MELDVRALKNIIGKAPDKPIAIISIAGNYRSGKSFILGLFLQYLQNEGSDDWIDQPVQHSFKFSNSDEGVTSGIWMWSEPFIRKDRSGRQVAVYLMDSQGWHDSKSTLKDNAKIFGLSALLSSVMILNIEKRVTETDLQYLQNFSFNAKIIDERNNEEPFQKLVILIRDWISTDDYPIGFYDNGSKIGGKDFVANKLKPKPDQTFEGQKLRELIYMAFEEVSACLLPHPGKIVGKNQYDSSKMDDEFRAALEIVVPALFSPDTIITKKFAGQQLTGTELFSLAMKWKEDFKTKSNPGISSYLGSDETQYQLALATALEYYYEKMKISVTSAETVEQIQHLLSEMKFE